MYSIYVDGVCAHDNASSKADVKFITPKLSLECNLAGSLEATIPPNNICYNNIKKMKSTVSVYEDGSEIWRGRVLDEDEDFYKCEKIICEGALMFLNDTLQTEADFNGTVIQLVELILDKHNSKVSEDRQIFVGNIIGSANHISANISHMSSYEAIKKVVMAGYDKNHVFVRVRITDSIAYLDIFTNSEVNEQTIEFGKNLLDFTRSFDMSDIATVIVPLGAKFEDSENRLTVESVNDGSIYVINGSAIRLYGRIEKVMIWDDIDDATKLLEKVNDYLSSYQFENMILNVSAVDLHCLNRDITSFKLYDNIRCISAPHGLDKVIPLTKIEIPIDDPSGTNITLGIENKKNMSSTFDDYTTTKDVSSIASTEVKKEVPTVVKNEIDNQMTTINQTILNTSVIKAETMQATWCFSKYILVQFLETNFDALDPNKPMPTNSLRKYIQIFNDNIKVIEAKLSGSETEQYKDPGGQPLYWTAIGNDADAYKFFTYSRPSTINKDKMEEGESSSDFDAKYAVMVRKTVENEKHIKAVLGFPLSSSGTGEPEFVLGAGDGAGNGKYYITKSEDGSKTFYTSRTDGTENGYESKDDGNYLITKGIRTTMYPIAIRADISDVSDLPIGTIIFQGAVT